MAVRKKLKGTPQNKERITSKDDESMKENIYNIPNALSFLRILLMPAFVFLIAYFPRRYAFWIFIIAAITDALDGQIARRFNQRTKFGALFDPLSDRVFMIPVVIACVIKLELWILFFLLTREAVAAVGLVYAILKKKTIFVPVRNVGKAVTVLQSIAVPAAMIALPYFQLLIAITSGIGLVAGITYVSDIYWSGQSEK